MEGVLEGRELAGRRAGRRADLGHTLARPWAWSWRARGSAQTTSWASASCVLRTRSRTFARAVSGSLGKPRLRTSAAWSPAPTSTRTVTICQRSPGQGRAARLTIPEHVIGSALALKRARSRLTSRARPAPGTCQPGASRRHRSRSALCDANSRTLPRGGLVRAGWLRAARGYPQ